MWAKRRSLIKPAICLYIYCHLYNVTNTVVQLSKQVTTAQLAPTSQRHAEMAHTAHTTEVQVYSTALWLGPVYQLPGNNNNTCLKCLYTETNLIMSTVAE